MLFSSHEFKKAKPDLFICIEKKLIQNTNKANIKIKRIFGLILIFKSSKKPSENNNNEIIK